MSLDFPSSPSPGESFSSGSHTWVWDGAKWVSGTSASAFVPIAGNVAMTGPLTLSGDPTTALGAATKQYADNHFLKLTGGALSGNLTIQSTGSPGYVINNTAGPGVATGNLWRVAVSTSGGLNIQSNTAAAGDFSTNATLFNIVQGGVNIPGGYLSVAGGAITSQTGRIISYNVGGNPSVTVWNQNITSYTCVMWQDNQGSFNFGSGGANGAPSTAWLWINNGVFNMPSCLFNANGNQIQLGSIAYLAGYGGRVLCENSTGSGPACTFGSSYSPGTAVLCTVWYTSSMLINFTYALSTEVGYISTDGGGVFYNSNSDARLKENVEPFPPDYAGAVIDQLEPVSFAWKAPKAASAMGRKHGFVAQDAYEVFPEAVSEGIGDEGDEDFRPWGMDQSKLMPLVIAELKALRTRVAQLEGKP